jgi:hypothetical protein
LKVKKTHLELFFRLLVCRKAKYILQKPTHKIKQPAIQLAISQLFQKLKSKSTNKQGFIPQLLSRFIGFGPCLSIPITIIPKWFSGWFCIGGFADYDPMWLLLIDLSKHSSFKPLRSPN